MGWICEKLLVKKYCDEVITYGFATVCVNPDNVSYAASLLEQRAGISCVVGFPCGAHSTKIKIAEGLEAISNGATDIDVVSNLSMLRNGEDKALYEQYRAIVTAVRDKKPETVIKFIVYAPYGENPCLTMDELARVSDLIADSGADYIKFFKDYEAISKMIDGRVKLKCCGIDSLEYAVNAARAGCERIGVDETFINWLQKWDDMSCTKI